MAWQVVADGAMVEIVLDVRNGREVTSTQIFREGTVINAELSKSMVDRYDENDPYVRSIVARVAVSEDDEGNTVVTAVGKPEEPAPQTDEEAVKRVEDAEAATAAAKKAADELTGEKAALEQQLKDASAATAAAKKAADELTGEKAALEQQLKDASASASEAQTAWEQEKAELESQLEQATAPQPFPWNSLSAEALNAEATKRGVLPATGSGANGNVVKADIVAALEGTTNPS